MVRCVLSLNFIQCNDYRPNAMIVEKSLRMWLDPDRYRDINRIFGCCGQLFCSTLPLSKVAEVVDYRLTYATSTVAHVLMEHMHSRDVALFFAAVATIRRVYRQMANAHPKKKYRGSPKNDEANRRELQEHAIREGFVGVIAGDNEKGTEDRGDRVDDRDGEKGNKADETADDDSVSVSSMSLMGTKVKLGKGIVKVAEITCVVERG